MRRQWIRIHRESESIWWKMYRHEKEEQIRFWVRWSLVVDDDREIQRNLFKNLSDSMPLFNMQDWRKRMEGLRAGNCRHIAHSFDQECHETKGREDVESLFSFEEWRKKDFERLRNARPFIIIVFHPLLLERQETRRNILLQYHSSKMYSPSLGSTWTALRARIVCVIIQGFLVILSVLPSRLESVGDTDYERIEFCERRERTFSIDFFL